VLQDEKDSESKCEVLLVKEPICISSDFVNASSKLGPFQDTGWRNRWVWCLYRFEFV